MLLKIATIIIVLVLLIRFKVYLALAIVIDAVLAGFLFNLNLFQIIKIFPQTLIQSTTLEFLFIIYMVLLMGELLRASGNLHNMVGSLEKVFKDYRIGVGVPSALIGLLPMPAGAMLSAPIVKEVGIKTDLTSEKMTYINFWFRHVWEYFWPLYPGIILSAGIFNIPIRNIMINFFPLTIVAIATGLFFTLRSPKHTSYKHKIEISHIAKLLFNLWPIILVIVIVLIVKLRMSLALAISVTGMIIFSGFKYQKIFSSFKKAFAASTLGVLYSVFLFKNIMLSSGALDAVSQISSGTFASQVLIIFLAPFVVGFLTGINSAFVGITFPVIAPFISRSGVNMSFLMFAYVSGFSGVLLSPVHLCLSLTKEYYCAELPRVYYYLIPSVLVVFAVALIIFAVGII